MKQVTKQFTDIKDGIKNLIKAANADYCDNRSYGSEGKSETRTKMEEQFVNGWTIKEGKKYIGIYKTLGNQQSIWGGVVKEDGGRFKKGDILKAAGYGKYAMNAPRGNVLEGNFPVVWTGANYLI
jgi:hypothetical protein